MGVGSCKKCKEKVPNSFFKPAKICPHCGATNPLTTRSDIVIGICTLAFPILIFASIGGQGKQEQSEATKEQPLKKEIVAEQTFKNWTRDAFYCEQVAKGLFEIVKGRNFKILTIDHRSDVKVSVQFEGIVDGGLSAISVTGQVKIFENGEASQFVVQSTFGGKLFKPFNELQLADFSYEMVRASGENPRFKSGVMELSEVVVQLESLKYRPGGEFIANYKAWREKLVSAGYQSSSDFVRFDQVLSSLPRLPKAKETQNSQPLWDPLETDTSDKQNSH